MRRFVVASGAALVSTLVGITNSVVVVRLYEAVAAARFFQVASLAILVAVVGEAGLGNYAVHDSARFASDDERRRYVSAALQAGLRRGLVAAALAVPCGRLIFDFDVAACASAALATFGTVVGIVGQALLRGTGRDVLASFGGPVGATILTGAMLAVGSLDRSIDPVHLAAAGYAMVGLVTLGVLWRPATPEAAERQLFGVRRTLSVGVSNMFNAAGRQLDLWIAGLLLTGSAFNSYALAAKIAATVGVVSFAANQATAADVHRWVDRDAAAGRSIQRVQLAGLGVVIVAGIGATAVGPGLGRILFGSEITISRAVLATLFVGYTAWAVAGSTVLALVAAERADVIVRSSFVGLVGAVSLAAAVAALGGRAVAAAAFVPGWLGTMAVVSVLGARRALGFPTHVLAAPRSGTVR